MSRVRQEGTSGRTAANNGDLAANGIAARYRSAIQVLRKANARFSRNAYGAELDG